MLWFSHNLRSRGLCTTVCTQSSIQPKKRSFMELTVYRSRMKLELVDLVSTDEGSDSELSSVSAESAVTLSDLYTCQDVNEGPLAPAHCNFQPNLLSRGTIPGTHTIQQGPSNLLLKALRLTADHATNEAFRMNAGVEFQGAEAPKSKDSTSCQERYASETPELCASLANSELPSLVLDSPALHCKRPCERPASKPGGGGGRRVHNCSNIPLSNHLQELPQNPQRSTYWIMSPVVLSIVIVTALCFLSFSSCTTFVKALLTVLFLPACSLLTLGCRAAEIVSSHL